MRLPFHELVVHSALFEQVETATQRYGQGLDDGTVFLPRQNASTWGPAPVLEFRDIKTQASQDHLPEWMRRQTKVHVVRRSSATWFVKVKVTFGADLLGVSSADANAAIEQVVRAIFVGMDENKNGKAMLNELIPDMPIPPIPLPLEGSQSGTLPGSRHPRSRTSAARTGRFTASAEASRTGGRSGSTRRRHRFSGSSRRTSRSRR